MAGTINPLFSPNLLPEEELALPVRPYLTTDQGILFNDDCLNVFRHLRSESVHLVFADPPFNLGKDYGNGYSDNLARDEYLSWTYQWLDEAIRVLVPGGALFIYNVPKWLIFVGHHLLEQEMTFRHWIALTMKSTFPRGRKLYPAHYGLLYFTKGAPRVFHKLRVPIPTCRHCGGEIKDYGGHRGKLNSKGLSLTDFWEDTSPVRHNKFKTRVANELEPVISERAVLMTTNRGDVIMDPFGGGGSTYQVAERNQRYWIGSEVAECEPVVERLHYFASAQFGQIPPEEVLACFTFREPS